jgi:hypothetical protein
MVLYELMSLRLPYEHLPQVAAVRRAILAGETPKLRSDEEEQYGPLLVSIFQRCTAFNPDQRPAASRLEFELSTLLLAKELTRSLPDSSVVSDSSRMAVSEPSSPRYRAGSHHNIYQHNTQLNTQLVSQLTSQHCRAKAMLPKLELLSSARDLDDTPCTSPSSPSSVTSDDLPSSPRSSHTTRRTRGMPCLITSLGSSAVNRCSSEGDANRCSSEGDANRTRLLSAPEFVSCNSDNDDDECDGGSDSDNDHHHRHRHQQHCQYDDDDDDVCNTPVPINQLPHIATSTTTTCSDPPTTTTCSDPPTTTSTPIAPSPSLSSKRPKSKSKSKTTPRQQVVTFQSM